MRWAGKGDVVVADPARVKSALLSFIEAQAWWGREGPITIDGGRVGDRLQLTVWRDGTELTTRRRRGAVRGTPARDGSGQQDRPVRGARRGRGAGRSRVGGRRGRTAVVPSGHPAHNAGLNRDVARLGGQMDAQRSPHDPRGRADPRPRGDRRCDVPRGAGGREDLRAGTEGPLRRGATCAGLVRPRGPHASWGCSRTRSATRCTAAIEERRGRPRSGRRVSPARSRRAST